MLNPKAVLAIGCACWLAACGSDKSAESVSADITKVNAVKSSFGPEFKVKDFGKSGIDPKMLSSRKLPEGLKFDPASCSKFATGQQLPEGTQGNMAAVAAEGNGNRFITIALETSEPIPVNQPQRGCETVQFFGGHLNGVIKAVDAPKIDGARTLGVHRAVRTVGNNGQSRAGELYTYSAHFGDYQVIVTANPLVLPNKPPAKVDTERAKKLLTEAVAAIRS
ncbi:DUF5642 family protein [Mycobacterium talmoniae]|uniref:DUF5642 domain-containing protein n=1 Tax=Mycobacterium talmoniae TaxID=1858794 RepID=A0A1S1NJK6_9MYCO|nr:MULTISPECIES: DUF5642 family protein [Mycobacterium]OHV06308.1 hypothetical protein BKN37_02630 [Mycobacterium talmoniae]PQM48902.1 hypothetical protein C1Y40_00876 [Mycobacterium talmoniae]TDH57572.1 hypothetical protein E2F47_02065 [Mycobacterium eburneum]